MPGSHPGDEWFESPARNHKIFKKGARIETTNSVGQIISMGTDFVTGLIGMMGDAVDAFMSESVLMLFVFGVPIGMLAFRFVKNLLNKRKGG